MTGSYIPLDAQLCISTADALEDNPSPEEMRRAAELLRFLASYTGGLGVAWFPDAEAHNPESKEG